MSVTPKPPNPVPENESKQSTVQGKQKYEAQITEKPMEEVVVVKENKNVPINEPTKTPKSTKFIVAAKSKQSNEAPAKKSFAKAAIHTKMKTLVKLSRIPSATKTKVEEEQAAEENSIHEDKEKSNEEYSLHNQLIPAMKEVSRQKLRSFQMALRKIHSSSEDGFVGVKDAKTILTDLKIHLHSRLLTILINECETLDEKIDHEKMITYFQRAHNMSGRDSIEAIDAEEIDTGLKVQSEITDMELYQRAEIQLMNSREAFDLEKFRQTLKTMDVNRSGILPKNDIHKVAVSQNCFIYGSLLNSLLRRSDQAKNNQIRWPEFINFLEKLYKDVTEKNPDFEKRFVNTQNIKPILSREAVRNKFKSIVARTKAMELAKKEAQIEAQKEAQIKAMAKDQKKAKVKVTKAANTDNKISKKAHVKSNTKDQKNLKDETVKPQADDVEKLKAEEKAKQEKEIQEEKVLQTHLDNLNGLCPSDEALVKDRDPTSEDLPTDKVKIEWVYGFRGQDALCNLNILASGELVYFTGQVVVLFDFIHHSQRHYCEHTDDIESLAVHNDGIVVASAQREDKNTNLQWHCRIWRTDSMTTMYILNNEGEINMCRPIYLRFSPTKNWLLVLDDSNDHILSLWDIKGKKISSISISRNIIQSISWDKKNENVFVTIGYEHIVWWEFVPQIGEIQIKALADHRGFMKARITLSLLFTSRNDMITGDSNGTIYIWGKGGNAVTNYIKHAHESYILALCMYHNFLITGDKRGQIVLWMFNKNLDNLGMIMLPQGEGGVRHMLVACYSTDQPVLIIGTTSNSLLQLPLAYGDDVVHPFEGVQFGVGGLSIAISQGHFGFLDCVSQVSSEESWFITAGRDGQICVFDGNKCLGVQKTMIKGHQFTCVHWTPNNSIVLGTIEGRCIILEQQDLSLVEVLNKVLCSCAITTIFAFPDGRDLYIGGLDGTLTVLSLNTVEESSTEEDRKWNSTTVQTPIYGIDFIQGGKEGEKSFLWLSNKSGGHIAYDALSLSMIDNAKEVKNIHWTNQRCGLIPNIAGAWMTPLMTSEGVSAASVNEKREILALGTNNGKIAIYKYPCLKTNAYCHSNNTSKPVNSLLFLKTQEHLISVAGQNSCITQWRLV